MMVKMVGTLITCLVPEGTKYMSVDRSGRVRAFKVFPRRVGNCWQTENPDDELDAVVNAWESHVRDIDWNARLSGGKGPGTLYMPINEGDWRSLIKVTKEKTYRKSKYIDKPEQKIKYSTYERKRRNVRSYNDKSCPGVSYTDGDRAGSGTGF